MPIFEVQIADTNRSVERPSPRNRSPHRPRMVMWLDEADTEELATAAAYRAWDDKYGAGQRPFPAIVKVSQVDGKP